MNGEQHSALTARTAVRANSNVEREQCVHVLMIQLTASEELIGRVLLVVSLDERHEVLLELCMQEKKSRETEDQTDERSEQHKRSTQCRCDAVPLIV